MDTPQITFVIPSLARSQLAAALQSLVDQTCPKWLAIVVFDCVTAVPEWIATFDPRVSWFNLDTKTGTSNFAAGVRVHGIRRVTTRWTAFLDDDDVLHPRYIQTSLDVLHAQPSAVFLQHRSLYNGRNANPAERFKTCAELGVGVVTIAQVWDTPTLQNLLTKDGWKPSHCEDFQLFDALRAIVPPTAMLLATPTMYAVRSSVSVFLV